MVPLLTELLGLPGIDVESYEVCEDGLMLDVEVHAELVICRLKLIKRSGYGFRNFERFRLHCLIN